MDKQVRDDWDVRIRADLSTRMLMFDSKWGKNNELIRNSGQGFRNGNLASEFTRMLQLRMLASDPQVTITPDDPDYATQAEEATIVASSVMRVAKLREALHKIAVNATWASAGWIEVGHPQDPWCLDVMRSSQSPGLSVDGGEQGQDYFRPVSVENLQAQGYDVTNVQAMPYDPFSEIPGEKQDPAPMFDATFGYPYLEVVDPRLVVTNLQATDKEQLDYVCRLRFITRKELELVSGYQYPHSVGIKTEYRDLFQITEGMDMNLFPEMILVANVWITRDRNNPEYNSYRLCYVLGEPESVVYEGYNQHGGMVGMIPLKLSVLKKYYDTTLADELSRYADLFDIGIKSLTRSFKRSLNSKYGVAQAAGLDPENEKKLKNDDYHGVIKMTDPNSLKVLEEKFDQDLYQKMNWVKSLAQSVSGASDIDRGQAIKDITARQTQALLEATGINVEGMKDALSQTAADCVMKLMHLVGIYNHAGRGRKYKFGNEVVSMDRGTHDFTSSYIYDVRVQDSKLIVSNEERVVWLQLLKTLLVDTGSLFIPYLDIEHMVQSTVRRFGEGPEMLASRAAGRPGEGAGMFDPSQVDPAQLGNSQVFGGAPARPGVTDIAYGQHRERDLGSQGVPNLSNALVGLRRIGS